MSPKLLPRGQRIKTGSGDESYTMLMLRLRVYTPIGCNYQGLSYGMPAQSALEVHLGDEWLVGQPSAVHVADQGPHPLGVGELAVGVEP